MKTLTLENRQGQEFEVGINIVVPVLQGYGNWHINFQVHYGGTFELFKVHTTDSRFIDQTSELEGQDFIDAYVDRYFNQDMEEQVLEWIEDLVEA